MGDVHRLGKGSEKKKKTELDQGHLACRTQLPLPGSVAIVFAVIVLIVVVSIVVVLFVVVLVIVVLVVVVLIDAWLSFS